MKRKQIDALGSVVEVDAPPATPDIPITPLRPLTVESRVPEPPGSAWTNLLANLTALHIILARFIRRHILLMPDVDLSRHQRAMTVMAGQNLGYAKMIANLRLRLWWHEKHIPLLTESRRRFDQSEQLRAAKKAKAKAETSGARGKGA